ncbi:MAG TPA: hypothetical protein P5295_15255 [Spirochaetota bacterium]|nr:hypothetical protein [Spirochaetota bacterium]
MTKIEKFINIGPHQLEVKGLDDGKSYIVNVFYKNYYIPPTYSYNHTDFNNIVNSHESGLFYGKLDDVLSDFIRIIETDTMIEKKIKIIDKYIEGK